jgi:hypothetical protein
MTIASFDFKFPGFVDTGSCYLTVDSGTKKGRPSVVCSQKKHYTGTSITNALEDIARKFYEEVARDTLKTPKESHRAVVDALRTYWRKHRPTGLHSAFGSEAVRWIEHYPAGTGLASGDTFREVLFDAEDSPLWQPSFNAVKAESQFGTALVQEAMRAVSSRRPK